MSDYNRGGVGRILNFQFDICSHVNILGTSYERIFLFALYIFHITVRAGKLVNARVFEVIVFSGTLLVTEEFAYSVLCFIGCTEVCMSEKFCDKTTQEKKRSVVVKALRY